MQVTFNDSDDRDRSVFKQVCNIHDIYDELWDLQNELRSYSKYGTKSIMGEPVEDDYDLADKVRVRIWGIMGWE